MSGPVYVLSCPFDASRNVSVIAVVRSGSLIKTLLPEAQIREQRPGIDQPGSDPLLLPTKETAWSKRAEATAPPTKS